MKKLVLPIKTYHNIHGPVSKILGDDTEIVTLIDKDFIDITSDDWKQEITKKLQSLKNNDSVFFVAAGHPAINIFLFNEAKKQLNEVKMLFWDSMRKKYHVMSFK